MKKYIIENLSGKLRSNLILAVAGGFILMSCGTQMGGYSETDGVYYDPNRDTLPEGVVLDNRGNQVGEYYDYNDSQIIEDVRERSWQENSKYWDDNASASDWGLYAGSETNFYQDNWGWGMPYGYYSPYHSYGIRVGMSWGWGSPWGWYDPFWGYSPYSNWGWYNGYYPYGWGSSYYGYYSPYYYGPAYRYQRSGANGRLYNSYQGSQGLLKQGANNGFRNQGASGARVTNQLPADSAPRFRTPAQRPNMQQQSQPRAVPRNRPNFNNQQQSAPRTVEPRTRSNDSGGFRSGGFNSGSSSSGGGFRSGGSTGGGMRSGGR